MDGVLGLLPYLTGTPALLGLAWVSVYLYRLWTSAVRELQTEHHEHGLTNAKLDAVREDRRRVEDQMDKLTRENRALKAEVARLRTGGSA